MSDNNNTNKLQKVDSSNSITRGNEIDDKTFINNLKKAEQIAEFVINSDTFGASFETKLPELDDNGKQKVDEDNNKLWRTVKNKNDVITTILVGAEIGIEPMAAIALGNKKLNAKAYTKVKRGIALGIDPITALDVIDIIPTGNGDVVSLGVHIMSKVLLENNIKIEVLKDAVPKELYYRADTKEPIDVTGKDIFVYRPSVTKPESLKKAKEENKIIVIRRTTLETRVRGTRGDTVIEKSYTLQDATDAGLYKGIDTEGNKVEGKDNWNKHPKTMLYNRPISLLARAIVADKLMNTYTPEEVSEFTDYDIVDTSDNKKVESNQAGETISTHNND